MPNQRKQLNALIVRKSSSHPPHTCLKAGVAFVNDDGSISIRLDVLPLDGRIELREVPPAACFRAGKIALA